MRRYIWRTQYNIFNIFSNDFDSIAGWFYVTREWSFGGSLNKMYPYGAQEWNFNWINKTGDEK